MTKEEQEGISPDDAVEFLKKGNLDFVESGLTVRNHTMRMASSINGQYPFAVILSCIDSRVPVEDIFQTYLGDLFVIRIAGNVINDDILGSLEFSCKVSGAKLVLVLGHTHCGAIKAAIETVQIGFLTNLINKIKPALEVAQNIIKSDKGSIQDKNDFVNLVCKCNIQESMNQIRINSKILEDMETNKNIKIEGAIYDLLTGKVTFLDN